MVLIGPRSRREQGLPAFHGPDYFTANLTKSQALFSIFPYIFRLQFHQTRKTVHKNPPKARQVFSLYGRVLLCQFLSVGEGLDPPSTYRPCEHFICCGSDGFSTGRCKPCVERFREGQDPPLRCVIYIVRYKFPASCVGCVRDAAPYGGMYFVVGASIARPRSTTCEFALGCGEYDT